MTCVLMTLLIIFMAVFAIWTQFYIANNNNKNLIENIKRYEKKKAEQQESKVSKRR